MSRYNNYTTPPRSPAFGFFPTSPAAPHAFSTMQGNPRDSHAMYSALGSAMGFPIKQPAQQEQRRELKPADEVLQKVILPHHHDRQLYPSRRGHVDPNPLYR